MGKVKNTQEVKEMELACRLTDAEMEEETKKLTELIIQKGMAEAEKKSVTASYNERIKDLKKEIDEQVPIVADRQKTRKVSVMIKFNVPATGKKTIIRMDTMEIVEVLEMTVSEKNDIFYNAGADGAEEKDGK